MLYRLDDKHVVFGQVESGFDVLKAIENVGDESGKPKQKVVIIDAGEIKDEAPISKS